ncbi:MAG: hypothetical protein ACOX6W_08890 [Lentisphaeria bacterium]|jgi:hypothetical protein
MTTSHPDIDFRARKLIEAVRERGGEITEEAAREHIAIELAPSPTPEQTARRREIIAHAFGKCKCGCGCNHDHKTPRIQSRKGTYAHAR